MEHPNQQLFSILDIYNVSKKDVKTVETLSDIYVDFSLGMILPEKEAFVNQELPLAVIHNCKTHNAHHDIILPSNKGNIAVSSRASFNLSSDKTIQSLYDYDQKITTPPGPYIISWAIHKILEIFRENSNVSITFLRCTNLIYGIAMPFLIKEILNSDWGSAIELSLFPLLFFYHFLYYTDTGSVFWVLLSYLASRKKLYQIAALD